MEALVPQCSHKYDMRKNAFGDCQSECGQYVEMATKDRIYCEWGISNYGWVNSIQFGVSCKCKLQS